MGEREGVVEDRWQRKGGEVGGGEGRFIGEGEQNIKGKKKKKILRTNLSKNIYIYIYSSGPDITVST